MKLMKKASEPFITRKRSPHDFNDCDLERFMKPKRMVQADRDFSPGCGIQETDRKPMKKLSPKLVVDQNNQFNNFRANERGRIKPETGSSTTSKGRLSDQTCSKRAGAQKPKVTTTVVTQRKPWKHLDEVDTDLTKMASRDKDKSVNSQPLKYDELKGNEVADFKRNKPTFGSKHAGKVNVTPRNRPPDSSNDCDLERLKKHKRSVQADRDFSPGCGIQETDRKSLKKLSPKLAVESNQINNFRANDRGRIKPETGSSTTSKGRFSDQTCSKSAGAQKPKVPTTVVSQRKPWKHLDDVDTDHAKMASRDKDKSVNSQPLKYDELKRIKVADFKRNKPSFGSKHDGKVNATLRKRPPDYSNDCDPERFKKRKLMVQADRDFSLGCGIQEADRKHLKKLSPKFTVENNQLNNFERGRIKPESGSNTMCKGHFSDQACSKSAGAQKPKVTTTVVTQRKHLDEVDPGHAKMASRGKDKSVNSQPLKYDELKRIEVADFKRSKPSFDAKPVGKVKFLDPTCTNESHDKQPKVTTTIVSRGKPLKNNNGEDNKPSCGPKEGKSQISEVANTSLSQKEHTIREKIKEAMKSFDEVYKKLYKDNRLKPKGEKIAHWRVPMDAAKLVQQKLNWIEPKKRVGPICGVHIGDKFKFRSQLKMTGLHCQHRSGIDYKNINGKNLAISIVDSHRYSNERKSSDMLVYCGHGGLGVLGRKLPPKDQKLERGNLALTNSMEEKKPVRVIRKIDHAFVYDGLYLVDHRTKKRSAAGKIVFNFHLKREPGQPPLHLSKC